jgi:hypothetical protein
VSCISRSQCTATGMAGTRSGKNMKTLAERWNGTTWAVQSTPTPISRTLLGGALSGGVSCTSSTACVADGFSYSKNSVRLLGEGWNGHTWTAQPDATPVVAAEPGGIACTWAKDCMAVGSRLSGKTLAEHWNGKAWSDQAAASPEQLNLLGGLSCPAVKNCVTVGTGGSMTSSVLDLAPLAEQWTGGKWAVLTVPDPAPAGDITELNSVSCTSATSCMAVGDYSDQAGDADTTLAEQWNGTTWTVVTTPSPAALSALVSVSCSSPVHCVAVGVSGATAAGAISPLTEVWDGTTWTAVTAPR